ncbi:MAG TPA: carboxypeptidase-like regulatory domain-containing protein, partial [Acidobacteriota bacterium]|nr:carboxypeptidase-like regulatory domain-containing protein [Acidobacteriota bacterium]
MIPILSVRFARLLFPCIAILIVAAPDGPRAAESGSIAGVILDSESRDTLVGASVYLPILGRGTAGNAGGRFAFDDLPPGFYAVQVSMIGYVRWRQENVEVRPGSATDLIVELTPTVLPLGEEIVVLGRRSLLDISEPSSRRTLR